MRLVSEAFKEAMKDRRDFKQRATVTLSDGTIINIDGSRFTISNNYCSVSSEETILPLGQAISKIIQIEISNYDGEFDSVDFSKARFALDIQFDFPEYSSYIDLGVFTALNPVVNNETIIIEAVDDMYKTDRYYATTLDFTQEVTPKMLLDDIASQCEIAVSPEFALPDIPIVKPGGEYTCRQIIGFLALMNCGNAIINNANELEIISYDFDYTSEDDIHILDEFTTLEVSKNDIWVESIETNLITTVDGVTTSTPLVEGASDFDSFVIRYQNPLIDGLSEPAVGRLLFNDMVRTFKHKTFRPFHGEHLAYPLAEFMDKAKIVDKRGNAFYTVLTKVVFNWYSFTEFGCSSEGAIESYSDYENQGTAAITAIRTRGINADWITEGTMSGDRINGGNAVLDGAEIKASNGNLFKVPFVQYGKTDPISISAKSIVSQNITFTQEFGEVPNIQLTMESRSEDLSRALVGYSFTNLTTTGFTLKVYNASDINMSPAFSWAAFCH